MHARATRYGIRVHVCLLVNKFGLMSAGARSHLAATAPTKRNQNGLNKLSGLVVIVRAATPAQIIKVTNVVTFRLGAGVAMGLAQT